MKQTKQGLQYTLPPKKPICQRTSKTVLQVTVNRSEKESI